jgi:hypothetical protein
MGFSPRCEFRPAANFYLVGIYCIYALPKRQILDLRATACTLLYSRRSCIDDNETRPNRHDGRARDARNCLSDCRWRSSQIRPGRYHVYERRRGDSPAFLSKLPSPRPDRSILDADVRRCTSLGESYQATGGTAQHAAVVHR